MSDDRDKWFHKVLPSSRLRHETAAVPYWLFEVLNTTFVRGLRKRQYQLKQHQQLLGLRHSDGGPLSHFQWMMCEETLERRYEEETFESIYPDGFLLGEDEAGPV